MSRTPSSPFSTCQNWGRSEAGWRIDEVRKKAQKAGGLCLALKGVPVKPTDDVDVEKEYRLIPIDSL